MSLEVGNRVFVENPITPIFERDEEGRLIRATNLPGQIDWIAPYNNLYPYCIKLDDSKALYGRRGRFLIPWIFLRESQPSLKLFYDRPSLTEISDDNT